MKTALKGSWDPPVAIVTSGCHPDDDDDDEHGRRVPGHLSLSQVLIFPLSVSLCEVTRARGWRWR